MRAARMHHAWIMAVCLLATAAASWVGMPKPMPDAQVRATTPLEQIFPASFGAWKLDPAAAGLVRPAFERARQFQMYDQVLERTYVDGAGHSIMLSVAYGRQQSVGLQMHRPEVCYKAGGFKVSHVEPGHLNLLGRAVPVTRLFASMEGRPEPITYWQLLGKELIADEAQFRLRQLLPGATGGIPDGLLVRISSLDEDLVRAYQLQGEFAQAMTQALTPAQRERVLGW